jgi:transcriptional regulator with XRE-family HTH domain
MNEGGERFPMWLEMTMRARGLSQAELARTMGVGETQVSRWRRGLAVPTVHSLQRLSETLGVPRATLDQMAGYPTGVVVRSVLAEPVDDEATPELQAYQKIFGELLEQRVPRELWHVYLEGCSAMADALGRSFKGTLQRAGVDDDPGLNGSVKPTDNRLGFREPSRFDSEQSGE